jgi:hypothetical protein
MIVTTPSSDAGPILLAFASQEPMGLDAADLDEAEED